MRSVKEEIAELKIVEKKFKVLLEENQTFLARLESDSLEFFHCNFITKEQEVENCSAMSQFLFPRLRTIAWNQLRESEYNTFRQVIDDCSLYVEKVTKKYTFTEEEAWQLLAWPIALKLGGKIPPSYLLSKEGEVYRDFILKNMLHHWFFAFRLQLPFNDTDGPSLPIKGKGWVLWKEIKQEKDGETIEFWHGKDLLFVTRDHVFTQSYSCLYDGIQDFDPYTDDRFIPFDKRNAEEWGNKFILEIWTVCQTQPRDNPSMFINTHAFFILRDDKGYLRCAGQDVLYDVKKCKKTELLSHKAGYGKICTPDLYVVYPKNSRQFWKASLEITKEQHDKIVEIVIRDKKNRDHSMSLLKKNCTSYVLKILREGAGLEIDASMHFFHILAKAFFPNKWYRKSIKKWESWYEKRGEGTKKILYFFPPLYIPALLLAIASTLANQNSYQKRTDFTLLGYLFRPWTMTCDHPLALHRQLERHLNTK